MFVIFGLVMILPCAILFQIARIDIWYGKNLRNLWSAQALDFIPIPAQRGDIVDDNGQLLVTNSVEYNLAVDPLAPNMDHLKINKICHTLAKFTPHTDGYYLSKIRQSPRGSRYVVLDKGISSSAFEALHDLNYRGLILNEQYKRRYNYDSLAAEVLGYVNHNMDGMTGLEKYYNSELKGEDGIQQVQRDKNGHIMAIVGAPRKKPINGYTLQTTLDLHLQAIVEEELKRGVEHTRADHGTAIVMDPQTGAIKAMANYPTYDPNHPGLSGDENRRNYAISDMIEPGSTFKIVMATTALDQGLVNFKEKFVTPKDGKQLIHGQWMRDHEPLGTMTFPEVIQRSSNIATADIAMKIPPDVFYQYARNYGFGSPTNIDLPNEEPGLLHKPYEWTEVSEPWMAVGYEVQVTPIQLAAAYSALANGGDLMRPYVVKRILDDQGNTIKLVKPVAVRQVAKKETFKKLIPVFEGVVSDTGTAYLAQIKGLKIAGKTGTAQTYIDGRYRMEYRASFVGFFPAEHPMYLCLVIMDHPRSNIYGGQTSAPVFKDIAERIIDIDGNLQNYIDKKQNSPNLAVIPNVNGLTKDQAQTLLAKQGFDYQFAGEGNLVTTQTPEAGNQVTPGKTVTMTLGMAEKLSNIKKGQLPTVPDVKGMSMRQAVHTLMLAGYKVEMIGSGTVFTQFPKAKASMQTGNKVIIRGKSKTLGEIVANNTK